jgi:hypothetical protein
MKSEVFKHQVKTQDEILAAILDLLSAFRDIKINPDEQNTIFAHELQSKLSLTVRFSNIYCEL